MRFIKHTINDKRIMGTDDMLKLETWIDASNAVHEDMKGVTGGCMSMGWGVLHAKASKQKINTKSICESELVGLSEYIPFKIYMINILMGQGNGVSTDATNNNITQTYASVVKNNSTAVSATTEKNNEHAVLIKLKLIRG